MTTDNLDDAMRRLEKRVRELGVEINLLLERNKYLHASAVRGWRRVLAFAITRGAPEIESEARDALNALGEAP